MEQNVDVSNGNQFGDGNLYWDDGDSIIDDITNYQYYKLIFACTAVEDFISIAITVDRRNVSFSFISNTVAILDL